MDPQSVAFQPRDDVWRFQDEMLRVQQNQAELIDRVSRLERQREDDSRLKNVWGTSSPFPSVLGGTPQQGAPILPPHHAPELTHNSTTATTNSRTLLQLR
jgi:ubiquitin carboxyl-terminal hydrolase 4/11/15